MKTENQEKLSRREKSRAKSNNDRMHAHSTANIKCIFAEISFWCSHRCRRCCCFPHFEIDTTYLILEIWAQTLQIFTSKIYGFVGEWHCICACSSTINAKKKCTKWNIGSSSREEKKNERARKCEKYDINCIYNQCSNACFLSFCGRIRSSFVHNCGSGNQNWLDFYCEMHAYLCVSSFFRSLSFECDHAGAYNFRLLLSHKLLIRTARPQKRAEFQNAHCVNWIEFEEFLNFMLYTLFEGKWI